MQTKLTLRMDKKVIAKAKRISRKRNQSVSKMFEQHVGGLPETKEKKIADSKIPEWIQRIWDMHEEWKKKNKRKKSQVNDHDARYEYLSKKYR